MKNKKIDEELTKEQKRILIIVGIACFILSCLLVVILHKDNSEIDTTNNSTSNVATNNKGDVIQFMNYTLLSGTYKGMQYEYDENGNKNNGKEISLTITKDKINYDGSEKEYRLVEDFIYIDNVEMFQVIGNNKIRLLAGAGTDLEYAG